MAKHIILISCVSKKLPHKAKAKDIYISTLFKLNKEYAELLSPDKIFILSAEHGLLDMEKEIEPYDKTLNNMPAKDLKKWANKVIEQLKEIVSLNEFEFTFLAGDKYRKYLLPHLSGSEIKIPLEGLPIGKQLQELKKRISELKKRTL